MDIANKFPFYYSREIDESENATLDDLSLSEYSICNKVAFDLKNYILGIDSYLKNQYPAVQQIELEKNVYTDTTDENYPYLFEELLEFLQSHADEFSIELGDGMVISSTFVENIKRAFSENEFLNKQPWFKQILEVTHQPDLSKKTSLPTAFANVMRQSLIQGLVEKLAYNFQGSEFSIGFNLSILEYNIRVLDVKSTIANIREMATYLYENCPHCTESTEKKITQLDRMLTQYSRFKTDGSINYSEWVFKNLEEYQIDRINKVKRLSNILLNNSVAELKQKLNLDNMALTYTSFLNTSITSDVGE